MTAPTILRADARTLPLADNSVDLVITSPPYFALRSYKDGGEHYDDQIGAEPTPTHYLDALLDVTKECARVLKPTGSLWVNLGDKYAGRPSGAPGHNSALPVGQSRVRQRAYYDLGQVRDKSLIGVPWRYAIRCMDELGLILRAEVIWNKPNGLPESVRDRVRRSHETWFHFTLQQQYYSAVDEIREPTNIGNRPTATWAQRKASGNITHAPDNGHSTGVGMAPNTLGKLPSSVWTVATQPLKVPEHLGIDHFAAFPMELPRRIIRGWSPRDVCTACGQGRRPLGTRQNHNSGGAIHRPTLGRVTAVQGQPDGRAGARLASTVTVIGYACACQDSTAPSTPGVVLDPFGGTGTTALVANALGRHGISVDASADYCRLAQWRTTDPNQRARAHGRKPTTKRQRKANAQLGLF